MTACTHPPFVPTANELFKGRYTAYLRWAALVAVALLAALFWVLPRYEPQPYRLRTEVIEIIEFETPPEVDVPLEKPASIPLPPVVEAVPEGVEETPDWADALEPIPFDSDFDRGYPTSPDAPFVVSQSKPVLVSQPRPEYPEVARMAGLEGVVMVKVFVGVEGHVLEAQLVQSVHPLLDRAALTAALRCRFEPGRQRDLPVGTWVAVPYRFRLH
jgi:protein TonB